MFYQPGAEWPGPGCKEARHALGSDQALCFCFKLWGGVGGGGGGQVTLPGTRRPTSPLHHHAMPCTAALAFQGHANED